MTRAGRRDAAVVAGLGALLFLVCTLFADHGPLAHGQVGDIYEFHLYGHRMASGLWPYRDFFDEYPPLAQPLFLLVAWLPGGYTHAWRWTIAVIAVASLVLMVATMAELGLSRRRLAIAAATFGVAPLLLGQSIFNEFDLWPAFLAAAALFAFVRRREGWAYALLALAVAAKSYPVVFLPIALMASWELGGRELVKRGALWFAGVFVLVHVPFAIAGPGGLRFSYWVQLKRGLEIESLAAAPLLVLNRLGIRHIDFRAAPPGQTEVAGGLAHALASVTTLVSIAALVVVYVVFWRRRSDPQMLAWAAAVTAFIAFAKSFSPQYVDWMLPLVPAAGALASGLLLVIFGLTHVVLDRFHTPGGPNAAHYKDVLTWWVLARDLLVVALYALLVVLLRRSPTSNKT